MPLQSSLVGATTPPIEHLIDARWLMAYAAGLGESGAHWYDSPRGLPMHPVFPVCVEWDSILALRFGAGATGMTPAEQARAIHADHDLHLLTPVALACGDELRVHTSATAVAVERRKPGAYLLKRLDTRDDSGRLLFRTWQGTLYREVEVDGPDRQLESAAPWPDAAAAGFTGTVDSLAVPLQAAHVYSECARIWNPIHTDLAHAQAAGLSAIILHGTATLALAVSRLVERHVDGDPARVQRLGGRFSGMVPMPTMLSLRTESPRPGLLRYAVATPDGRPAISRGYLEYLP